MNKKCTNCYVTKPITKFPVYEKGRDGHRSYCDVCYERSLQRKSVKPEHGLTYRQLLKKQLSSDEVLKYEVQNYHPVLYNSLQ